jgi:hypothetical protein
MTWATLWANFGLMFSGANGIAISTVIIAVACLYSAASHHYGWAAGAIVGCGAAMTAANIAQTTLGG